MGREFEEVSQSIRDHSAKMIAMVREGKTEELIRIISEGERLAIGEAAAAYGTAMIESFISGR